MRSLIKKMQIKVANQDSGICFEVMHHIEKATCTWIRTQWRFSATSLGYHFFLFISFYNFLSKQTIDLSFQIWIYFFLSWDRHGWVTASWQAGRMRAPRKAVLLSLLLSWAIIRGLLTELKTSSFIISALPYSGNRFNDCAKPNMYRPNGKTSALW